MRLRACIVLMLFLLSMVDVLFAETSYTDHSQFRKEHIQSRSKQSFRKGSTIQLSGSAATLVSPNTAHIHFLLESEGENSIQVQNDHAEQFSRIEVMLTGYTLKGREFNFNSYPDYAYAQNDRTITIATTQFFVTLTELSGISELINQAILAGVSGVTHIHYESSRYTELYDALLVQAYQRALEKAKIFAEEINKEVIEVMDIVEVSSEWQDVSIMHSVAEDTTSELVFPPERLPGVQVWASVDVIFGVQ